MREPLIRTILLVSPISLVVAATVGEAGLPHKKTLVFTKTSCAESWESKHLRAQLVMHMQLLIGIHAWKLTGQGCQRHIWRSKFYKYLTRVKYVLKF